MYYPPPHPPRPAELFTRTLLWQVRKKFSRCTLCEFGPCLRTHQECYLLSVEVLVAVVGTVIELSSSTAAHVKKRFDLSFSDSIPYTGGGVRFQFSLTFPYKAQLLRYE